MLEGKDKNIETIYVNLLNEGVNVWRPVRAKKLKKNIYQILNDNEYDEEDEKWEFWPGAKVLCEKRKVHDGIIIIAVKEID